MMHQSEFDAANVALSRAADKRKSLINIHENWYTATLNWVTTLSCSMGRTYQLLGCWLWIVLLSNGPEQSLRWAKQITV